MKINGILRFPPCDQPLDIVRVRVTVRDITEFDAPAHTVAQLDLPAVHVPTDGMELPFTIHADLVDPARIYVLRAHADVHGCGSVTAGDLVTTTAHVVGANIRDPLLLSLEQVH